MAAISSATSRDACCSLGSPISRSRWAVVICSVGVARPTPRAATSSPLTARSPAPGVTSCGMPAASAVRIVPAPPWWTVAAAAGNTTGNGSHPVVRTLAGSGERLTCLSGRARTTSTSIPAAACTTRLISRSGRGSATVLRLTMIRGRSPGRVRSSGATPSPGTGTNRIGRPRRSPTRLGGAVPSTSAGWGMCSRPCRRATVPNLVAVTANSFSASKNVMLTITRGTRRRAAARAPTAASASWTTTSGCHSSASRSTPSAIRAPSAANRTPTKPGSRSSPAAARRAWRGCANARLRNTGMTRSPGAASRTSSPPDLAAASPSGPVARTTS
jgi:hypothetical protein